MGLGLSDLGFLGGIAAGGGGSYDVDAQAMFDKRLAVSDEPTAAYKQAISNYVTDLKAVSGLWDKIIQLVVIAGATTAAGASKSIKGLDLINGNDNFIDADIGIKTGSKGNNFDKYWFTGYAGDVPGTTRDDFHFYAYLTELPSGSTGYVFSNGATSGSAWSVQKDRSRSRRGTSDFFASELSVAGGQGLNRNNSGEYQRMLDNGAILETIARGASSTNAGGYMLQAMGGNASNTAGSCSDSRHLIHALGPAVTTLADYNTPANNLVAALNSI